MPLDLGQLASALRHAGYSPIIDPGDMLVRIYARGDRWAGVAPCADHRDGYRVVGEPDHELLGEWVPFAEVKGLVDGWIEAKS